MFSVSLSWPRIRKVAIVESIKDLFEAKLKEQLHDYPSVGPAYQIEGDWSQLAPKLG